MKRHPDSFCCTATCAILRVLPSKSSGCDLRLSECDALRQIRERAAIGFGRGAADKPRRGQALDSREGGPVLGGRGEEAVPARLVREIEALRDAADAHGGAALLLPRMDPVIAERGGA